MNRNVVTLGLSAAALMMVSASAQSAEVFAQPSQSKSGAYAYNLSAFADKGEDGFSFTIELPQGAKNVSIASCGAQGKGGVARCFYEPTTRKLAVAMFRLDGQPIEAMEHNLGQVTFEMGSRAKLQPIQVDNVQSASRTGSAGRSVSNHENSTNAER